MDNVVAVIPARGGSKGVPLKNIRKVGGIPLIVRAINSAKAAGIKSVIVATDHEEIADTARDAGADVFWQPSHVVTDSATSEDALTPFLSEIHSETVDTVVAFIQCTDPFIPASDIQGTVELVTTRQADSALCVCEYHGFLWDKEGFGINHRPVNVRKPRQENEKQYLEKGSVYAFRLHSFMLQKNRFCGPRRSIYISNTPRFEIDSIADFDLANHLARFG